MKFSLAIATLALSDPSTFIALAEDDIDTNDATIAAEVNEMIQSEQGLIAEEIDLLNQLNSNSNSNGGTDRFEVDFNGDEELTEEEAEDVSAGMSVLMATTTSVESASEPELIRDTSISEPEPELTLMSELAEPATTITITEPEPQSSEHHQHEHHETKHQHKKSERERTKADKHPDQHDVNILKSSTKIEAKAVKEEPHHDTVMSLPQKKTSTSTGTTSKASKYNVMSLSNPTAAVASKGKAAKSKSAKRGKVRLEDYHSHSSLSMPSSESESDHHEHEHSHPVKKAHSKTRKNDIMSMSDERGEQVMAGKANKGSENAYTSDTGNTVEAPDDNETVTISTLPASSTAEEDETTTTPNIIIFTEAPGTEDEEDEDDVDIQDKDDLTKKYLETIFAPTEEEGETSSETATLSASTETQPVVRTPDMKPSSSGTDTSDLSAVQNSKYNQVVMDAILNGGHVENDKPLHSGHHNKKEDVDALDLGNGESRLENSNRVNGAAMSDVSSSGRTHTNVIVGGFCLLASSLVAYTMLLA